MLRQRRGSFEQIADRERGQTKRQDQQREAELDLGVAGDVEHSAERATERRRAGCKLGVVTTVDDGPPGVAALLDAVGP